MRWVFAANLLLCLITGCDKKSNTVVDAGYPGPPVDVRIGYFANLTHAQAVLGVADGEFSAALNPATVSTKVFNAGPSLIEALIAGEIDLGYVGPGPALTAWSQTHGQEIRVIAGAAANGVVIVAGPKSNIHSLADLAGKKIATPQRNNTQDISARHYYLSELHQPDDANVIAVQNAEQAGRMTAGDIDAAWVPEPWGSRLVAQAQGTLIGEEKDLWPGKQFTLTVVIASPKFLSAHPDIVRKFLTVHQKLTQELASSPAQYAPHLDAALFALTKNKLPAGVMDESLKHVLFTTDPGMSTLQTMAQWSFDLGVIKQKAKLDGLVDTSYLPQ